MQTLAQKLRATEETLEAVQSEYKQSKWEYEDQLSARTRALEKAERDLEETMAQRDAFTKDLKNQLWNRDLELKTERDKHGAAKGLLKQREDEPV